MTNTGTIFLRFIDILQGHYFNYYLMLTNIILHFTCRIITSEGWRKKKEEKENWTWHERKGSYDCLRPVFE